MSKSEYNGALADGLTFVRLILTPIIMLTIIKAWSGLPDDPLGFVSLNMELIVLSTVLFAIAAITDIADDFVGGSAHASERMFGWFDDIADSVLIAGTLIALMWVTHKAGLLHWTFAVPAIIYIVRDIGVAMFKGYELSKGGFLETRLGDVKSIVAMLATCTLVASPWLSNFIDSIRANDENAMQVYDRASTLPWNIGLVLLAIAAVLALITGYRLITSKPVTSDEVA